MCLRVSAYGLYVTKNYWGLVRQTSRFIRQCQRVGYLSFLTWARAVQITARRDKPQPSMYELWTLTTALPERRNYVIYAWSHDVRIAQFIKAITCLRFMKHFAHVQVESFMTRIQPKLMRQYSTIKITSRVISHWPWIYELERAHPVYALQLVLPIRLSAKRPYELHSDAMSRRVAKSLRLKYQ